MARFLSRFLVVTRQRLFLCNVARYQCCRRILTAQQEEEMFGETPLVNIHDLYDDMKKKLEARRFVKASQMNTLLNNCRSKEDIEVGVELIRQFRSSLSKIRPSTGAVTVRACCRVGSPEKALEMMQDKITYGVFFSKSAYDYLVQHFCQRQEFEKAVETYEALLDDDEEIQPLWKTLNSAVYACCFLGTDGIQRALKLISVSRKRKRFMSIKFYYSLGVVACQQNDPDACLEIMRLLAEDMNVQFPWAQVGLMIRALVMKGDYREAVCALESLLNHCEKLEVLPHSTLELVDVVTNSSDSDNQAHLKDVIGRFTSLGKRMPELSEQSAQERDENATVDTIVEVMGNDNKETEAMDSSYLNGSEHLSLNQSEDK